MSQSQTRGCHKLVLAVRVVSKVPQLQQSFARWSALVMLWSEGGTLVARATESGPLHHSPTAAAAMPILSWCAFRPQRLVRTNRSGLKLFT